MTVEEAGDRLISIAHESYPAIVAKEGLEMTIPAWPAQTRSYPFYNKAELLVISAI